MKKILVACDQLHIDVPLRRSLGHLLKSCHIDVVHNGDQAFDELHRQAYDLIIIDFDIPGVDSLELVESIQFIDPGVPVILMLQPAHRSIWDMACHLKAHPIICPFKPLTFLRLVDKLLHKQLNRYRRLADTLTTILETLTIQTTAPCAFLSEESGEVLITTGEKDQWPVAELSAAVVESVFASQELPGETQTIFMPGSSQINRACSLYVTQVTDGLCLALLSSSTGNMPVKDIWPALDRAATQTRAALYSQVAASSANGQNGDERAVLPPAPLHRFISVQLEPAAETCPPAGPDPETEDFDDEWDQEMAVNWGIITDNSDLLSRLQDFCQIR